jgi:uncharacterized membrane protein YoaK (UPF0700 family)
LLSFAAGSMDAIAFLKLDEVFTSAMSGNTILLGLAVGQGRVSAALHSFTALIGYIIGVAIASLPLSLSNRGSSQTLALEAVFLAVFAGLWAITGGPLHPPVMYSLIVLSAIAMGLQGAIGRWLKIPGIMTVIFTSTYTAIVGGLTERIAAGSRPLLTLLAKRQLTTLAIYLGSAMLSGFVILHWLMIIPFVPLAAVLILVFGVRLRLLHFPATE